MLTTNSTMFVLYGTAYGDNRWTSSLKKSAVVLYRTRQEFCVLEWVLFIRVRLQCSTTILEVSRPSSAHLSSPFLLMNLRKLSGALLPSFLWKRSHTGISLLPLQSCRWIRPIYAFRKTSYGFPDRIWSTSSTRSSFRRSACLESSATHSPSWCLSATT